MNWAKLWEEQCCMSTKGCIKLTENLNEESDKFIYMSILYWIQRKPHYLFQSLFGCYQITIFFYYYFLQIYFF